MSSTSTTSSAGSRVCGESCQWSGSRTPHAGAHGIPERGSKKPGKCAAQSFGTVERRGRGDTETNAGNNVPRRVVCPRHTWFLDTLSGGLLHFPGAQTARTDAQTLGAARCLHTHALQVRVPTAICEIVGVADIVAVAWSLATDVTALSHGSFLSRLQRYVVLGALSRFDCQSRR